LPIEKEHTVAQGLSSTQPNPRRWLGVTGLGLGVFATVLDTTVLTVAIPALMRDLHASLPAIQWVIAGYSLVFASLLVGCGRLGDLFGHRRMVVTGLCVFGAGSLIASLAGSGTTLFVGDALIEGVGAAMMSSSSLALVSASFAGGERGAAFGVFGGLAGIAGAFGPVVGGWLTTDASWRWAFRINVGLAPILVALVLYGVAHTPRRGRGRERLDLAGAGSVTIGLFLLVFAVIEASRYGWWHPLRALTLNGTQFSPHGLSLVPLALAAGTVFLVAFVAIERRKDRLGKDPLIPFSRLAYPSYRYGVLTTGVLAAGEFTMFIVLSLVLQGAHHFSALRTGLWILPFGVMAVVGAGIGVFLAQKLGAKRTVVTGMALETFGLVWVAIVIGPGVSPAGLIPAIVTYGMGMGFATAQLGNITLADIPSPISGVASGINNTIRQVGAALGIAMVGSAYTSGGARPAVLVAAGCVCLGVIASSLVPGTSRPARDSSQADAPVSIR
jgi:MFS family permease